MKKLINTLKRIDANEWFVIFLLVYMLVLSSFAVKIAGSYSDYICKFDGLNKECETLKYENNKLAIRLSNKTDAYEELVKENLALSKQLETKPTDDILQIAGDLYGIDPKLLEAIERLESGHYTSEKYKTLNNTWGAYDGVEYKSFESHEQSTMELARTLKYYYIDQGLDSVEAIGSKYCPDDSEWASKVMDIYNELD